MQHITMHHSRYIHVALATAEPIVANRLLKSIQQALPGFEVKASVLLFGMAEPIKHFEFCIPVDVIDCLHCLHLMSVFVVVAIFIFKYGDIFKLCFQNN